jgi:hypothetical protein
LLVPTSPANNPLAANAAGKRVSAIKAKGFNMVVISLAKWVGMVRCDLQATWRMIMARSPVS